jgi:phage shock protein E
MDWYLWIIIGGMVAAFFLLKRMMLIPEDTARNLLDKGAQVIDVRSEQEFRERHLPGAVNVPLDRLSREIPRLAPDKEQSLLLHCLSGARSGMGTNMLKKMGYTNAFNLGSYGRAERIINVRQEVKG